MFFGMMDTEQYGKYDVRTRTWIPGVDNQANIRVEDYNDALLYLYPGGSEAVLTALINKISKKAACTDPNIHWFTKTYPKQYGAVTSVWQDPGMTVAYAGGGMPEDPVYLWVPADTAILCRPGHQVLLRYTDDPRLDVVAKVINVTVNGNNSTIGVRLIEPDDNAPAVAATGQLQHTLADCDNLLIIGNSNPEGAGWPLAISRVPEEWQNHTQIFLNSSEITRTAAQSHTRFAKDGGRADMLKETLLDHSTEKERAFIWGQYSKRIGDNGHPERTMMGIIPAIKRGGYVSDFRYEVDPLVAGQTWQNGWYTWIMLALERCFRYGSSKERIAFCGSRAWIQIQNAIRNDPNSEFVWDTKTKAYGIRVVELITVHGVVYLMPHPLFMYNPIDQDSMLIFDPTDLVYRFLQDTVLVGKSDLKKMLSDSNHRGWTDSFTEGWLTEVTLEFHNPVKWALLTGFGYNNVIVP